MHIGERIQQKMKEQHISQNKLAKAAQISQSGLSSIISGASSPKENTLQAIAKALDCPVSELIGEPPDIQPKTIEARTVSAGMDKLPKEQREMILNMVRAMFPNKFAEGDEDNAT